MMTAAISERRRSPRVYVPQLSVYFGRREHYVRGDVSSGGVGFILDELIPFDAQAPIRVELALPEGMGELTMTAFVRHQRQLDDGSYFIGAVFEELDELVQYPLERFVDERHLLHRQNAHPH